MSPLHRYLSFLWTLVCLTHWTTGHPQCLDYKPPFSTTNQLCPRYSEFGCCSTADVERIQQQLHHTRNQMGSRWAICGSYVEELLCQKCSPYAAHIFDAETSLEPRKFPGLCGNYCESFYDNCRDVVQYIDSELYQKPVFSNKHDFCAAVAIPQDIDYCYPELLDNPLFNDQISNTQVTQDGCLCLEEVVTGLRSPIVARHAGDSSGRMFIGEQFGIIYIYFLANKTRLHTPFLDITHNVLSSSRRGDERGFFSIAFHPNFRNNGRFFLYYSTTLNTHDRLNSPYNEDVPIDHKIRISEMHVSRDNPNRADLDTERTLLEVIEPYWNHNGGEMLFGDDNYLYLFIGDGGSAGDPFQMAQNRSVHLGKILRIDVDTPNSQMPYSIPPDNPFLNMPGVRPEIFAYGVRNIWRCGKDRGDRETAEGKGRILCGDVGQSAWEELDLVKKGANYGWDDREAFSCFQKPICGENGPEELPVYAYPHSQGKSVTGGVFYRGCESPNLNGMYFYGDYMNGRMFSLTYSQNEWKNKEVFMCESDVCQQNSGLTGSYRRWIISFGEDQNGEVYLLSTGSESAADSEGKVYKLLDPKRRGNPEDCLHADGERVDLGELVTEPARSRPTQSRPAEGSTAEGSTARGSTARGSTARDSTARDSTASTARNPVNGAPRIVSLNIRTCAMATTLMCVLRSIQN